MLKAPTPFPHVGSFALLVDKNLPIDQQRAELVRILRHGAGVTVTFPLRVGASANRIVDQAELIDGTPLDKAERVELADLQRHLHGRPCNTVGKDGRTIKGRLTPKMKQQAATAEALRKRLVFSTVLGGELAKFDRLQARSQPSTGRYLPREAA